MTLDEQNSQAIQMRLGMFMDDLKKYLHLKDVKEQVTKKEVDTFFNKPPTSDDEFVEFFSVPSIPGLDDSKNTHEQRIMNSVVGEWRRHAASNDIDAEEVL